MICDNCFGRRKVHKEIMGLVCELPCMACSGTGLATESGDVASIYDMAMLLAERRTQPSLRAELEEEVALVS